MGGIAGISNTCLQAEQIWNVPPFQRNLPYLTLPEGVSNGGIDQVQRRSFTAHGDHFVRLANLELYVRGSRRVDQQLQSSLLIALKSGRSNRKGISARRDKQELILSLPPRLACPLCPGSAVGRRNG